MSVIRFLTAGESHGKSLMTIVEGFPANIPINAEYIDAQLARRQMGYGRGGRMKIENDRVEIQSGVRFGLTLGSPIGMLIQNKDWENWIDLMSVDGNRGMIEKISVPRPGHADLTGTTKYNFDDIRNSIERSSARETAARVAACSVARKFLEVFGIRIGSFVESIGGVYGSKNYFEELIQHPKINFNALSLSLKADKSCVRVFEKVHEEKIINRIKLAKKKGDTLGGTFIVAVSGLPAGLGSFMHYDKRIDAALASAMLSINAVKGVEIGNAFSNAEKFGSFAHDEIIIRENKFWRKSNRAGGVEGGITTGLPLLLRGAMKPIATLMSPIETINLKTMKKISARRERSDFVAVPACAVIAETMTAWVVADFFLQKFGGDSIEETKNNFSGYAKNLTQKISKRFK